MKAGTLTKFCKLGVGDYFKFVHTNHQPSPEGIRISYLDENDISYSIHPMVYRKEDFCLAINMKDALAFKVPIYPNMKVIKVLRDGSLVSNEIYNV